MLLRLLVVLTVMLPLPVLAGPGGQIVSAAFRSPLGRVVLGVLVDEDGQGGGSRVVVAITAELEDYLESRITGHVVEGKQGFTEATTLWTFVLRDGRWLVNNIEPDAMLLTYAGLGNELEALVPPGSQGTPASGARETRH